MAMARPFDCVAVVVDDSCSPYRLNRDVAMAMDLVNHGFHCPNPFLGTIDQQLCGGNKMKKRNETVDSPKPNGLCLNFHLPFGFGKNVSGAWLDQRDANTGRTLGNNCGLWTTFNSGGVVACIQFNR